MLHKQDQPLYSSLPQTSVSLFLHATTKAPSFPSYPRLTRYCCSMLPARVWQFLTSFEYLYLVAFSLLHNIHRPLILLTLNSQSPQNLSLSCTTIPPPPLSTLNHP